LYGKQDKYDNAEFFYLQALDIIKNELPLDHKVVKDTLEELSKLYSDQRKYSQAASLLREHLSKISEDLGADHKLVLAYMMQAAEYYTKDFEFGTAASLYRHVLEAKIAKLGPEHKEVADLLDASAELFQNAGLHNAEKSVAKISKYIKDKNFFDTEKAQFDDRKPTTFFRIRLVDVKLLPLQP